MQTRHIYATTAIAALSLAAAIVAPKTARAQTIVIDRGNFQNNNAFNMTLNAVADDFQFTSTKSFNHIRFWIGQGTSPSTTINQVFSGTVSWFIHDSGLPNPYPGGVLFSGTATTTTLTDTGVLIGGIGWGNIYQADIDIPTVTLPLGSYWLRLKENGPSTLFDGSSTLWMASGAFLSPIGSGYRTDPDPVNPTIWGGPGNYSTLADAAFQLSVAAPEPTSLLFIALGGSMMLIRRCKRQK
jgi:hypothetical protein